MYVYYFSILNFKLIIVLYTLSAVFDKLIHIKMHIKCSDFTLSFTNFI
jgi:hypothetical protein